MKNLTDQLYSAHGLSEESVIILRSASQKTMDLLQDVNKMKEISSIWKKDATSLIFAGPGGVSWPVLFGSSAAIVYLGSHGLPPSAIRNVGLIAVGFMTPIILVNGIEYISIFRRMHDLVYANSSDKAVLNSTILADPVILRHYTASQEPRVAAEMV
jgi:hypothetical protein